MKGWLLTAVTIFAFLLTPMLVAAQTGQPYEAASGGPPIAQPLVREGTLAVQLVTVLNLGSTTSEVDAESLLSAVGIAPHNGWIADYPVTPDIVNELRAAVENAVAAGTVNMSKNDALVAFDSVTSQDDLNITQASGAAPAEQSAGSYPEGAVINNYYYNQGPPVVTYYTPPVDYTYLYDWVPYPFWWWGLWFPGFYVLADFDVPVFVGGHVFFCSNHFFDRDHDRFERVHGGDAIHGRVFAHRVVGPSVVRDAARTVFRTDHHVWASTGLATRANRSFATRSHGATALPAERGIVRNNRTFNHGSTFSRPAERSPRTFSAPSGVNRSFHQPMATNRGLAMTTPSERPHSFFSAPRSFSSPHSGRTFSAPAPRQSFGGRSFGGFGGGGRSFGGGHR